MKLKFYILLILHIAFSVNAYAQNDGARGSEGESSTAESSGVKRALVIGISKYKSEELNLKYADDDAELFKEYLVKIDSIPEENVELLINKEATSFNISNALNTLIEDTNEGDKVYLFFAGHGDVVDKNNVEEKIGFLLAHDVNKEREYYGTQGVIPFKDINATVNTIANKNAKIILVLDACKSGFLYLDGTQKNLEAMNNTFENSTKLLSCKPNQLSYEASGETSEIQQGFFTHYLVLGLMGAADNLVQDFNLQSFELQSFLDTNVAAATANKQSPVVKTTKSTEILKKVNSNDKTVALNQIQNASAIMSLLANRNDAESDLLFKNYTDIIDRFNKAIAAKNYYGNPNSAKQIVDNALNDTSIPINLKKSLKNNLINTLSLEAQTLINNYISDSKIVPSGAVFTEHAKYLDICLAYMDTSNFLYNRFVCSKLFLEAYATIKMKRFDNYLEAKNKLLEAIDIEKKAAYLYNALGIINNDLEFYDAAKKNYLKAQELIPTWSYPINNLGSNYLDTNNYIKAIELYEKAGEKRFAKKSAYNNIGATYNSMGRFKESEAYYLKSGEVDGEFLNITLRNLAKIYRKRGNPKKALDYFEKAYQQDSTDINILTDYSEFLVEEGIDPVLAEKLINSAIKIEPYQSNGYRELADYYRRFKLQNSYYLKADSLYDKAIKLNPHDTWAYAGKGWNYKRLGKEDVEAQFLRGIDANPQKASAYQYLANYYSDTDKKETYYKKAIAIDSFYLNGYKKLIGLYNKQKTYNKSHQLLRNILKWNNQSPDIYNLEGHTFFAEENYLEAAQAYKKAIEVDSTYANGLINLAYCELKNKNYQSSYNYFIKSFEANPYKFKRSDYAQYFLLEARLAKADKIKLYEFAYKLDANLDTKYALAKNYYMANQTNEASQLLSDVDIETLSKSKKIKYLKLSILLLLDEKNSTKASSLLEQLNSITPRKDKALNALVLYYNGNQQDAKTLLSELNPYFIKEKQLRKTYNTTIVDIIKTLIQ